MAILICLSHNGDSRALTSRFSRLHLILVVPLRHRLSCYYTFPCLNAAVARWGIPFERTMRYGEHVERVEKERNSQFLSCPRVQVCVLRRRTDCEFRVQPSAYITQHRVTVSFNRERSAKDRKRGNGETGTERSKERAANLPTRSHRYAHLHSMRQSEKYDYLS